MGGHLQRPEPKFGWTKVGQSTGGPVARYDLVLTSRGKLLTGSVRRPRTGGLALFGEATHHIGGDTFSLSTTPRIYGGEQEAGRRKEDGQRTLPPGP